MRSWELKGIKKEENLQIVKFIDLLRDPLKLHSTLKFPEVINMKLLPTISNHYPANSL